MTPSSVCSYSCIHLHRKQFSHLHRKQFSPATSCIGVETQHAGRETHLGLMQCCMHCCTAFQPEALDRPLVDLFSSSSSRRIMLTRIALIGLPSSLPAAPLSTRHMPLMVWGAFMQLHLQLMRCVAATAAVARVPRDMARYGTSSCGTLMGIITQPPILRLCIPS